MNFIKNMEAVFVMTLGLTCAAVYVADALPDAPTPAPVAVSAYLNEPENMTVVTVTGKRMTPAEKRASLEAERKMAGVVQNTRSAI